MNYARLHIGEGLVSCAWHPHAGLVGFHCGTWSLLCGGLIDCAASRFWSPWRCRSCFGVVLVSGSAAPLFAGCFDAGYLFHKALCLHGSVWGLVVVEVLTSALWFALVPSFPCILGRWHWDWDLGLFGLLSLFLFHCFWLGLCSRLSGPVPSGSILLLFYPVLGGRFQFSVPLGVVCFLQWCFLFSLF